MRSMEFSGRTIDEAIFHGLNEMGVTIDEVMIETLQSETKGLFGLGAKMAVVRLTEREAPLVMETEKTPRRNDRPREQRSGRSAGARPEQRERRPREEHVEAADEEAYDYSEELAKETPAAQFLAELLSKMGIDAKVLAANTDNGLRLCIDAETMGILIGRRGETLDALQYIVSLYANRNRKEDGYLRITLDTEGYRFRREETLRRLARKSASKARATGRPVTMEPMNPYERRVLHSALQGFRGVSTHSEGEEPNRHVVIVPDK